MATQQPREVSNVLKAYAFTIHYNGKFERVVGAIASSHAEALAGITASFVRLGQEGKLVFSSIAFACLEPATIEWWEYRPRTEIFRKEGYYAFLEGMFFLHCGERREVSHCGKRETSNGWYATIYGCIYRVITKKS